MAAGEGGEEESKNFGKKVWTTERDRKWGLLACAVWTTEREGGGLTRCPVASRQILFLLFLRLRIRKKNQFLIYTKKKKRIYKWKRKVKK